MLKVRTFSHSCVSYAGQEAHTALDIGSKRESQPLEALPIERGLSSLMMASFVAQCYRGQESSRLSHGGNVGFDHSVPECRVCCRSVKDKSCVPAARAMPDSTSSCDLAFSL